jgi:hypothetical protein
MRQEPIDRRVLGALRFIDSTTGLPVSSNLSVNATGLKFVRNLSGHYVIAGAAGLEEHEGAFEKPPAGPAPGSLAFEISVDDPNRKYLSRRHTIRLPRDPDPQNAAAPESLFRAVEVRLFPSSTAATGVGWAVIRASVFRKGTSEPLSGVLLRVTKRNGAPADEAKPLGIGLTDRRGEALVNVPGIPVITFAEGEGEVTTKEIDVTISALFDPDAAPVSDPDDLEARRATLKSAKLETKLRSGHTISMKFEIPLP